MARIAYSSDQKREAVALARSGGAEWAAKELGIDPRTIRNWLASAGDRPELDGSAESWRNLLDAAQAKVAKALANPKLNPATAATIAGIAERNLRQLEDRVSRTNVDTSSVAAQDVFFDWVTERVVDEAIDDAAFAELCDALAHLPVLLLVRANLEDVQAGREDRPRARPILAWHSGRTDVEADGVLEWAQAQVEEAIVRYGSFLGWHRALLAHLQRKAVVRRRSDALRAAEPSLRYHEADQLAERMSDDHPDPFIGTPDDDWSRVKREERAA